MPRPLRPAATRPTTTPTSRASSARTASTSSLLALAWAWCVLVWCWLVHFLPFFSFELALVRFEPASPTLTHSHVSLTHLPFAHLFGHWLSAPRRPFSPSVYAPKSASKLPVMLFFHGGSFEEGSNQGPFYMYDASALVAKYPNVVVVTANYRCDFLRLFCL